VAYPPPLPPTGNTDNTPADGGYHADALHNVTGAALAAVVAEMGSGPKGSAADLTARLSTLDTTVAGKQAGDVDLDAIAALDSSTAGAIASDGGGWIKKTYAQFKTALGLVKADVGLGNVDNTSDANKPVSTAQAAADALALAKASNLSDVANTTTARSNLGLGTAATANKVAAGSAGVLDATDATTNNARTPTAHASTHQNGGSDPMAVDAAAATGSLRTLGTGAAQAAAGNDSRLSDARTPTAHATSHKSGGTDSIKLNELAAPTAAVALNAQKITGLADGSAATDGAAFGQIVTLATAQTITGLKTVTPASTSTVGLIVQGLASQSANIQDWRNSGGTARAYITNGFVITSSDGFRMSGGQAQLQTNVTTTVPVIAQGAASQTADLLRCADSALTALFAVTAAGLPRWYAAANQQTTVGATGAASALPALPTKYLKVVDSAGTTLVIPAYAAS